MSRNRWSKFWWQDWQRDPALRSCGLAARGLWMELLCLAHEGEPYGHVVINGRAATNMQIAKIVGHPEKDIAKLLHELEYAGAFSRTDQGVIYSRRMVRDKEISDQAAIDGKSGGNPVLRKGAKPPVPSNGGGGLTPPLNLDLNGGGCEPLKPLEARSKNQETYTTYTAPSAADAREAKAQDPEIVDIKTQAWREGKRIVRALTGQPEREAGALVGKLAGILKSDCAALLAIVTEAERLNPLDPSAWLIAAATARGVQAHTGISQRKKGMLRAAGLWNEETNSPIIEHETETQGRLLQ